MNRILPTAKFLKILKTPQKQNKQQMQNFLWNYKTQEYEITEEFNKKDGEAVFYIPQTLFAQETYKKLRRSGFTILDSLKTVLRLYAGPG